jgi:hypothetical protein
VVSLAFLVFLEYYHIIFIDKGGKRNRSYYCAVIDSTVTAGISGRRTGIRYTYELFSIMAPFPFATYVALQFVQPSISTARCGGRGWWGFNILYYLQVPTVWESRFLLLVVVPGRSLHHNNKNNEVRLLAA